MRLSFLLLSLALAVPLVAQERRPLMSVTRHPPATFVPRGQAKAPPATERQAVQKLAGEWVKRRSTVKSWKASAFEFVGLFQGSPGEDKPRGEYQVYRMKFSKSPEVGKELLADLLFYAQERELIWPPWEWPENRTPPGQTIAVVTSGIHP